MHSVGADRARALRTCGAGRSGVCGVSWTHLWRRTRNPVQPSAGTRGRRLWRSSRGGGRTETTGWKRKRSHLESEGRGPSLPPRLSSLPGNALSAFPSPLGLRPYARDFLGPVAGSRDATGVRPGPFPVNTTGIQSLPSPALLLQHGLGSFCTSERPSPLAPRSLWSWASHLSALNLPFHVCKAGARVSTSRGCTKSRVCNEDPAPWVPESLSWLCTLLASPSSPGPESAPNPCTTSQAAEPPVRPAARVGRGGLSGFLSPLLRDWERNRGLY